MKTFNEIRKQFNEGFTVEIPKQTIGGKEIGGGKTPIFVKAKTTRQAISMAAKRLGVDFKMLKVGKVLKEHLMENRELDKLKKKFKADLKKYEKDGYFKNPKANQAFMDYAMDNGEVNTDDPDDFEAWMDRDVREATNPFSTAAKADRADAKLAKVNKKDDDKDRLKVANRKLKDARSKKYADAKKDLETKHGKGSDAYIKARDAVKKKLGIGESTEINEALSKYDINNYRWPEVKFKSSSYANDAASALEKKLNWKSYDNWFDINGDKLEFSTYKLKEPEALVAFKKATGIDLKRI